jgi:hypothetical protein
MSSLKEYISIDQVECLNEDNTHTVKNLFSADPESCLRSDCDPQLLLSIPFTSPVKLNGVRFTFRTGVDPACSPSEIRVFSNEGFSLIVMCHPCDTTDKDSKEESFREATGSLATQAQSNTKFIRFKQRLCVCGKCTLPESKAVGPFRSVAMLLRGTSSVVVIRNGGLVGMWQGANSGKLSEFIMKYV